MTGQRLLETICCICHRKKGKNGWRKEKVKSLANLSHGYCPECYRQTMVDHGFAIEMGVASR